MNGLRFEGILYYFLNGPAPVFDGDPGPTKWGSSDPAKQVSDVQNHRLPNLVPVAYSPSARLRKAEGDSPVSWRKTLEK